MEIYGEENTKKELILMNYAIEKASKGEVVLFIDSRGSFRPERFVEEGLADVEALGRIDVLRLAEGVRAFERISKLLALKKYRTILWDGMSIPFYELQVSFELGLISRMLSLYSLRENTVLVTNPIVSLKGKPLGYQYTDPYVHVRARAEKVKEDLGSLKAYGWSAKYRINGLKVYLEEVI